MKSKLALIQGPPGTGKTMVGLKIVELLLNPFFVDTRPCIFLIDSNVWKYAGKKAWLSTSIMSFFCLKIEEIAACSMNFISTCPCFKSSGLRSATVA
jgi:type I site-specific restriction endonuclease